MSKPLVSAGLGVSAGTVAAFVQWIFSMRGVTVPPEVLPFLTGIFMYVGHYVEAWVTLKFGDIAEPIPAPTTTVTQQ
jgi:hypothetical protein